MKKLSLITFAMMLALIGVMVFVSTVAAWVGPSGCNHALYKDVSLQGTFFTGGWGGGMTVDEDTVTDGVFLTQGHQWDQGAVWWDSRSETGQYLIIELGDTYNIRNFTVQADNNDGYKLYYWDGNTSTWQIVWNIPEFGGPGMQTREATLGGDGITTNKLKFEGNDSIGDKFYSVSEIQAWGDCEPVPPVPEMPTIWLIGGGLLLLGGFVGSANGVLLIRLVKESLNKSRVMRQ